MWSGRYEFIESAIAGPMRGGRILRDRRRGVGPVSVRWSSPALADSRQVNPRGGRAAGGAFRVNVPGRIGSSFAEALRYPVIFTDSFQQPAIG